MSSLFEVQNRVRAWNDANGPHKMGWFNPGDVVEIPEDEYSGFLRFELHAPGGNEPAEPAPDGKSYIPGTELFEPHDGYNQYWVKRSDVTLYSNDPDDEPELEPEPVPEPGPSPDPSEGVSNEEAGAALRTLVRFLRQIWN